MAQISSDIISIETLETLSRMELCALWQNMMPNAVPSQISQPMLRRLLAHEIQLQRSNRGRSSSNTSTFNGLSRSSRSTLNSLQREMGLKAVQTKASLGDEADHLESYVAPIRARRVRSPKLQPGSHLLREWNGHTHRVDVVETGFIWRKQRYKSLSAIARAITGAHWSGPRFFGLNRVGRK